MYVSKLFVYYNFKNHHPVDVVVFHQWTRNTTTALVKLSELSLETFKNMDFKERRNTTAAFLR